MDRPNAGRAIVAGFVATLVMTMLFFAEQGFFAAHGAPRLSIPATTTAVDLLSLAVVPLNPLATGFIPWLPPE
jgi:hypothetical protein